MQMIYIYIFHFILNGVASIPSEIIWAFTWYLSTYYTLRIIVTQSYAWYIIRLFVDFERAFERFVTVPYYTRLGHGQSQQRGIAWHQLSGTRLEDFYFADNLQFAWMRN